MPGESDFTRSIKPWWNDPLSLWVPKKIIKEKEIVETIKRRLKTGTILDELTIGEGVQLLDDILPDLPSGFNERIETKPKLFIASHDRETIERVATASLQDLTRLVRLFAGGHHRTNLHSVFLRSLYYAAPKELEELLPNDLLSAITVGFQSKCRDLEEVSLTAATIITEKIPSSAKTHLLSLDVDFKVTCMLQSPGCRSRLEKLFRLDELVFFETENWPRLRAFLELDYEREEKEKNLEMMVKMVSCRGFFYPCNNLGHIARIVYHLVVILDNLVEFSNSKKALKPFLSALLNFRWEDEQKWNLDVSRLEDFLGNVMHFISQLRRNVNLIFSSGCKMCRPRNDHSIPDTLNKAMRLVKYLEIINVSWHQWFDIYSAEPLLEARKFQTVDKSAEFEYLSCWSHSTERAMTRRMLTNWPSIISMEFRKRILRFEMTSARIPTPFKIVAPRGPFLETLIKAKGAPKGHDFRTNWEVTFKDELAKGPGTLKEFYTMLSRQFQEKDLDLWLGESVTIDENRYVHSLGGLYPRGAGPAKADYFILLGQLMAKVIMDDCLLDIPLATEVFARMMKEVKLTRSHFNLVKTMPEMAGMVEKLLGVKRMKETIQKDDLLTDEQKRQQIDALPFDENCSFSDLSVYFVAPQTGKSMKLDGEKTLLTAYNLEEYLELLSENVLEGIALEDIKAMRWGFDSVYPMKDLNIFSPEELRLLICGVENDEWTVDYLLQACRYSNGYQKDSRPVLFLMEILSSWFSADERNLFLKFVTGYSKLPHGGLRGLVPPLTVLRVATNDDLHATRLPSAMTCHNNLFLPEYKSLEVMRDRLLLSMREASSSFQLM